MPMILLNDIIHAQADVLLRVYAQKQDAHRKKLVKTLENDFYSDKEEKTENSTQTTNSDSVLNVMLLTICDIPKGYIFSSYPNIKMMQKAYNFNV